MSRTDAELLALVYRRSAAIRAKRYGITGAAVALAIFAAASSIAWQDRESGLETFDDGRDTQTTVVATTVPTDAPTGGSDTGDGLGGDPTEGPSGGSTRDSASGSAGGAAASPTTEVSPRQAPEASSVRRTAPFDYGCLKQAPCQAQDERTRGGNLEVAAYPEPPCGTTYVFPPGPRCTFTYESSYVGIEIAARRSTTVSGSAVVHQATGSVTACITFVSQDGGGGEPELYQCKSVPLQGSVTISSTFEHPQLSSGTFGVYVTLRGQGSAVVDSISYTLR